MTAPDPRVGEIQARLDAATPGPWVEYHENGTPGQVEAYNCPPATGALLIDYADWDQKQKDANFIANAPADVAYLLGLLRERDEALAAVAVLAETWRYKGEFGWGAWQEGHGPDQEGYVLDQASSAIRAAVAAANGDQR